MSFDEDDVTITLEEIEGYVDVNQNILVRGSDCKKNSKVAEGIYKGYEIGEQYSNRIHNIQESCGRTVSILGTKNLNQQLESVNVGDLARVLFLGRIHTESGHYYFLWRVSKISMKAEQE